MWGSLRLVPIIPYLRFERLRIECRYSIIGTTIMHRFWTLFLFVAQQLCQVQAACNGELIPEKRYVVNLDLPPEERWGEVAHDNRETIFTLTTFAKKFTPPCIYDWANSRDFNVKDVLPYPYGEELEGIAKTAGVPVGNLFLKNLMLELSRYVYPNATTTAACTTVIAQSEDGTIYTARTLDSMYEGRGFTHITDIYKRLSITVEFQRNGRTVYIGSTWAGYVGLQTGQNERFTIALNAVDTPGSWQKNIIEAIRSDNHALIFTLIRHVLADSTLDFERAVKKLSTVTLSAACYFIVGGSWPGEAVVITRARKQVLDLWWIGNKTQSWFMVQTNSNHWETGDLSSANRKNAAIKALNRLGQKNLSPTTMLDSILCIPPILRNITLQAIIMSASIPWRYQQWGRPSALILGSSKIYTCRLYY